MGYFRSRNREFCEFCDKPKKASPAEKRSRQEPTDSGAASSTKKRRTEGSASQPFEIGELMITKIRSRAGEALYRPADDVVCDKDDFGGHGKKLMALMKLGM